MKRPDPTSYQHLYTEAFPSKRTGALYSACSYPTKISPESIAVFIASHTRPGDTVLDVFAGSGTTGLAAHLCARPTPEVLALADRLKAPVTWGPRKAVLKELSVWGAFIAQVLCNPPAPDRFRQAVDQLLTRADHDLGAVYTITDPAGNPGTLRYAIWSEVLVCPECGNEVSLWDATVQTEPLLLKKRAKCPACRHDFAVDAAPRSTESYLDPILGDSAQRRKRVLKRIYGQTGTHTWWRDATVADQDEIEQLIDGLPVPTVPLIHVPWGDLHRSGYHHGITHLHHFYTPRNVFVMSKLWQWANEAGEDVRDAMRLLVLSYNAAHATLMTRVVVKQGQKDFVVTGAQSGVLYVSGLPVEKNIVEGLRRKASTFSQAFETVYESGSQVTVECGSSTQLDLPDRSVDYLFTDPPFGDFIPYSEVSFLNEAWLGQITETAEEAIISNAQAKSVNAYGELLAAVFTECARVLKDDGQATVVFHSAKASVWSALQQAYRAAGLRVAVSGVLDKLQTTFKQTNSVVKVQGDPLLLLTKRVTKSRTTNLPASIDDVIVELWHSAQAHHDDKERSPERLYSRFVNRFLEQQRAVPLDASRFYSRLHQLLGAMP